MWKHRFLTALVVVAAVASGCRPPAMIQPTPRKGVEAPVADGRRVQADPRAIAGVAEFPARLATQATAADVVNAATLQLIDPATNLTVVSGVMTNGGSGTETFSLAIPSTFAPSLDQTFLLEAVKGLGSNAPGNEAVRLRTFVQWKATGWTSVTGSSTIALTAMTTAVALISSIDPTNVPAAQTIGDVTYNLGTSTFTGALPGHAAAEVNNLTTSVNRFLAGNVDPVSQTGRLAPLVTGLSVARGAVGDIVAVYGDGFSPVTGAATVSFNGTNAGTYMVRSRTAMYVVVPSGATTGNVRVTTENGASNGMPFMVSTPGVTTLTPIITGLSRNVVRRGDTLTLTGHNFDANVPLNTVTLNGTIDLPVAAGTASWLRVTVPVTAVSGAVTVTNVNGTSGAFYLGVLTSTPRSLVENFTSAATKDTGVTSLEWSNNGLLGQPALVNWSQRDADFSALSTLGASADTFVNTYPKGGGVGMRHTADFATYTPVQHRAQFSAAPHQAIATNGDVLLAVNSGGQTWAYRLSRDRTTDVIFDEEYMGYPFLSSNANHPLGLAGLNGSNVFYYGTYGTMINKLSTLIVDGASFRRGPDIDLGININKYSTFTYGFHLGSNGMYLYLWGGQSTGNTAYSSYVYQFAISGTTATLIKVIPYQPSAYPQDSYNYYHLTADDSYVFLPGYSTYNYDHWVRQSNGTSYNWTGALPFNNTTYPYNNVMCYDLKNDCYWITSPGNVSSSLTKAVSGAGYSTVADFASVVSPAISLPGGQVWDTVNVTTSLPVNTAIRVEVLRDADDSVLFTVPQDSRDVTASLRSALAGYTGSVKLRAYLSTTNAARTPYLTGWNIKSAWATPPLAQSNAYDTRVTTGAVTYMSYTVDQPPGAPQLTVLFSDSPDGNTWSAWTPNITTLGKRYIRWQIQPPADTSYAGPLASRVQVDFQY